MRRVVPFANAKEKASSYMEMVMPKTDHVAREKNPLPPESTQITRPGVPGGPALDPMKHREAAKARQNDEGPVPTKPEDVNK